MGRSKLMPPPKRATPPRSTARRPQAGHPGNRVGLSPRPSAREVLDLQRHVGNAGTTLVLQRRKSKRRQYVVMGRELLTSTTPQAAALVTIIDSLGRLSGADAVDELRDQALAMQDHLELQRGWLDEARAEHGPNAEAKALHACDVLVGIADELDGAFTTIRTETTRLARSAHESGNTDARNDLLEIANEADVLLGERPAPLDPGVVAPRTGRGRATDVAHAVLDPSGVVNDAGGGIGGGAVSVADLATGGLTAAGGPVTSTAGIFGGIAGGLGVVFGIIGVGLGINATRRGAAAEERLNALIEQGAVTDEEVKTIVRFAAEKKRKKKFGGGIGITLGAGAIAAGVLGLVAIGASTFGIGAAVLGIGMALLGLGAVLGKWIHRARKRKAFAGKLRGIAAELLDTARAEEANGPVRRQIESYGVVVDWDSMVYETATIDSLEAALGERVESRRELAALSLVGYLTGPPSVAMFDAETVVTALGLDPGDLRQMVASDGAATAQARIAAKLSSW